MTNIADSVPSFYFKFPCFSVESLFINLPLEKIINFILKKVSDKNKIQTSIPKTVLKELLYLCTKQLLFTFNNNIHIQRDGVRWTLR